MSTGRVLRVAALLLAGAGLGWMAPARAGEAMETMEAAAEGAAEAGLPPGPYWPGARLVWRYNPAAEPDWLPPGAGRALFRNAAEAWRGCGPAIEEGADYNGPPRRGDGINAMGWARLPPHVRGITLKRQTGPRLLEADVLINPGNADLRADRVLLQKVVTHEFGHALGLIHSGGCADVMSSAARCGRFAAAPPPTRPTAADLAQCRARYPAPADF